MPIYLRVLIAVVALLIMAIVLRIKEVRAETMHISPAYVQNTLLTSQVSVAFLIKKS